MWWKTKEKLVSNFKTTNNSNKNVKNMFQQHLFWQLQPSNSVKGQAPRRVSVATFGTCQVLLFPDDSSCISSMAVFSSPHLAPLKKVYIKKMPKKNVDRGPPIIPITNLNCDILCGVFMIEYRWNCDDVEMVRNIQLWAGLWPQKSRILLGERSMFFL